MRHIFRFGVVSVILIVVSACSLPGQQSANAGPDEETVTVRRGSLTATVSGSGIVQPARRADLVFNVNGTVAEVLVEPGETVDADQELARLNTDVLQAQHDAAQAQVDAAQAQIDRIESADENTPQVDTSDAGRQQAEAQLRQAQAQLRQAELSLENATLRAPFAGLVTEVNISPGDTMPGGTGMAGGSAPIIIADTSSYYVELNIGEIDIVSVAVDQRAIVEIDALNENSIEGTVRYVAPAATVVQNVATYRVEIDLPDGIDNLRIGMSALVDITQDERTNVLLVPNSAVRTEGNRSIVRLWRDERFVDTTIETGISSDTDTEVLGGLNEGDVVAAIGVARNQ